MVGFTYVDGQIQNLVCDCFCSYTCKHEFAAMLQLKETLQAIKENYPDQMTGYFAAVSKAAFFNFAVVLAPGGISHSGPGGNRQLWPDENSQS